MFYILPFAENLVPQCKHRNRLCLWYIPFQYEKWLPLDVLFEEQKNRRRNPRGNINLLFSLSGLCFIMTEAQCSHRFLRDGASERDGDE